MKVFISWSGERSAKVAEAFRDWLPAVIQAIKPYYTPSDIEKGARWLNDISQELSDSSFGILCITRENIHSDWMLFEAGALSKSLEKSHVCPILFGITNADVTGPLKQFQATSFSKADVQKLINAMNNAMGDARLPQKTLDTVYATWWPQLEEKIVAIMEADDDDNDEPPLRNDRELLEEILMLTRAASRRPLSRVSQIAIKDLLRKFIEFHDHQATATGGYQEALDKLDELRTPVNHLVVKLADRNDEEIEALVKQFKELSFSVVEEQEQNEEQDSNDDIPF
ncbi:TIR domain-containing protein [Pseudohaliea sp.]|uniref:TIR domain-containing protein n=1 Tax=Pseudohaliea sp. TaxID=2740289 RepID=UPI0032EAFDCF